MKSSRSILFLSGLSLLSFTAPLYASFAYTPANVGSPVAVQPNVGLTVTGGMTAEFFSDVSALSFPGPAILNILGNVQAFDAHGSPIAGFDVTGVTVQQGSSTSTPPLGTFDVPSPTTFTSTLNPFLSVTVNPSQANLAFTFNSDSSFRYDYALTVTGIPNGGFITFNDVEAPFSPVPEPRYIFPLILLASVLVGITMKNRRRLGTKLQRVGPRSE